MDAQPVVRIESSVPKAPVVMTERKWDPEDPTGRVQEKRWENGKLVASATTETHDPAVAKTFHSDVTAIDTSEQEASTVPPSDRFLFRQALDASHIQAFDCILGYLEKQVCTAGFLHNSLIHWCANM